MDNNRTITDIIFVSCLAVTLLFFQSPAQAQSETQQEIQKEAQADNLDYIQLEDEFLQTSTDDVKQQQKEQREEAKVAKQEEKEAFVKLKKSKNTKAKVEAIASKKIARDREIQKEARRNRDTYNSKTVELEKDIMALEKRIAKTEAQTKTLVEEAKKAKDSYRTLKQKRNHLRNLDQRAQYEKQRAERDAGRKVARSN